MIYIQLPTQQSPHFYAAAEEWMLRHLPAADYVFTYVNQDCVVVGKNQSIWRELNWQFIAQHPEKIVRRISGGGTVYHDAGNICFGFLSPFEEKKVNNYKFFNQPIVDALARLDIHATFSPRNDLLLDGKKISGNAQFTDRKMMLSHGTLLFQANLEALRFALQKNEFEVETKAVSSVRSVVMNIAEKSNLDFHTFYEKLRSFLPIEKTISLTEDQLKEIQQLQREKYETINWAFGHSPKSTIRKKDCVFVIENGYFSPLEFPQAIDWVSVLDGCLFHPQEIQKKLLTEGRSFDDIKDILDFLF